MSHFSHLKVAALSDVGKKRKNNEDAYGVFPDAGVFCVADGMGGGDDGEIASAAVVRAVEETVAAFKPSDAGGFSAQDVSALLERNLSKTSAWICHRAHVRKLNGCGSTFVGVVFDATEPERALAVHAGDSRLYLLHGHSIVQITRDHSVAELMGEKDESKVNPMFRSMVVNGIGIRSKAEPEFTPFKIAAGDRVLICSDGLTRMVPDKKMASLSRAEEDPAKAVKALIDAALAAGGVDNVTAVLVEVGKLPAPVLRLAAPPLPELDSEAETLDDMTTGGGTTGSTGGTVTCATVLPDIAEEQPFGSEAPADAALADGAVPMGEGETGEEDTAERSEVSVSAPKRTKGRMTWILAVIFVAVAAAVAAALALKPKSAPLHEGDAVVAPVVTNALAAEAVSEQVVPDPKPNDDKPALPCPAVTNAIPVAEINVSTNGSPEVEKVRGEVEQGDVSASEPITLPVKQSNNDSECLVEFSAACEEKNALSFVHALRRMCPKEDLQIDFYTEAGQFLKSAKQLARTHGPLEAEAAAVDLRVLLLNAESVRTALASRRTDPGVEEILSAWNEILSGDSSQAPVQRACVRLMKAFPEVLAR